MEFRDEDGRMYYFSNSHLNELNDVSLHKNISGIESGIEQIITGIEDAFVSSSVIPAELLMEYDLAIYLLLDYQRELERRARGN